MLRSFGNKDTKKIWEGERVKGFSTEIQETARRKLRMLNNSQSLTDLIIPPSNNLEKLTPDFLSFKVKDVSTPQVQSGTIINYNLKIHGIPVNWRTLIEEWHPNEKFIDQQQKGPYKKWALSRGGAVP